ncbi:glycosyltransferase [Pontimonas sp.]|nr:glycosyltransferase [Pontimonas sp.]
MFTNSVPRASHVVTDSKWTTGNLVRFYGLSESRSTVLGLPIDQTLWNPPAIASETSWEGSYFVYPAKLWPHKNHRFLVDVLDVVAGDHPDVNFLFTGLSDDDADRFEKVLNVLPGRKKPKILGNLDRTELRDLVGHSNGLLMPSLLGPTNLPPLEALALGVPAFVSDAHHFDVDFGEALQVIPTTHATLWAEALSPFLSAKKRFAPPRSLGSATPEKVERMLISQIDALRYL